MTFVRGHQVLGIFVDFPHDCPGWETCAIARYLEKQEAKRRRRFFSSLRRESGVELGHASTADYSRRAANSEDESEPALPQAGDLILPDSPSTS